MGTLSIPKPGTKHGPCRKQPCTHPDCLANASDAAKVCRLCAKPVGYGVDFYYDDEAPMALGLRPLVHAICLHRDIAVRHATDKAGAA